MTCQHANPSGYRFCGTCGEEIDTILCRCGFVASLVDTYCGRCGISLAEGAADARKQTVDVEQRFDLEQMAKIAAEENKFLETTHKVRVTQDDIRKLLAIRRKRF